jgi:hypothetical protein
VGEESNVIKMAFPTPLTEEFAFYLLVVNDSFMCRGLFLNVLSRLAVYFFILAPRHTIAILLQAVLFSLRIFLFTPVF